MAEHLQLQLRRHHFPNGAYLLQAQLSGQHHPLRPQVIPRLRADMVGHGLLGADVPLAVGRILPRQCKRPQIRQDQRIHAGILQPLQILRQLFRLLPAGHGVHRHMDGSAVLVGIAHRLGQLLRRKIPRKGAHSEGRSRQIHGVRPV